MGFYEKTRGLEHFQHQLQRRRTHDGGTTGRHHRRNYSTATQVDVSFRPSTKASSGQGTTFSVYVNVLLSIWGIMVFLRYPYIVGQCGLIGIVVLFTVSYSITTVTALSLSAIASNGIVRGGGAYYLISRTVGSEIGAGIGLVFYLSNVISGSLNASGFTESLLDSFGKDHGTVAHIFPQTGHWPTLYSSCLLIFCTLTCCLGVKVQLDPLSFFEYLT